ncbi:unnamed protein product [Cochlearia groenlandica]
MASSSSRANSSSSDSASRLVRKRPNLSSTPNEQISRDEDKLSPVVGSATDRASDLKSATMPTAPPSAPGSSSQPGGRARKASPPKRTKVSAKSVLEPIGTKKKSSKDTKPKSVKPVHFFTSSKSKLSGSLGQIRSLSASGGVMVSASSGTRLLRRRADDRYVSVDRSVYSEFGCGNGGGRRYGVEMTLRLFEEISRVSKNHSLEGTWSICWKPGFKLTSDTSMADDETNDHGFEFFYNGATPYVNHAEASASFQYGIYSAIHGEEFPNGLVFAEEIAQLARLEQRVAYKRTLLNLSYEKLLASAADEKGSAQKDLDAAREGHASAEKERNLALAKVSGLEKDLQLMKKEKSSRKLKEKLGEVELENAELKKKLEAVTELSRARDLALEKSREVEGVVSAELAVLKGQHDGLRAYHDKKIARLRRSRSDHVAAAKVQFARLRDASEVRLGRLKAYLDEEVAVADNYLLYNQMRGVFGTIGQLKTQYAIDTPPIFERQCRDKEDRLRRWLEDREKFSYEPSDFVLPSDIEISVPEEISEPEDEAGENVAPAAGQVVGVEPVDGQGEVQE